MAYFCFPLSSGLAYLILRDFQPEVKQKIRLRKLRMIVVSTLPKAFSFQPLAVNKVCQSYRKMLEEVTELSMCPDVPLG